MQTDPSPTHRPPRRTGLAILLGFATLVWSPLSKAGEAGASGEQIYQQRCSSCHGARGEGSKEFPRALEGDRSTAQLAKLIAKTMPEDDPGTCVGEEAEKVAGYIHDAFYSKAARERGPRVALSRLTVRQYRNAAADLIGSFREPGWWGPQRGLHGEYFKARRLREGERVIDRTDPEVRFDFGEAAPSADEKFKANEFSIRWEGSVLAPETGEYEFIIRSEHAVRMWLNGGKQPLIDNWVRSGNDTEHVATIVLLGGRAYPLRLEFTKAKQGVDDSKKDKDKPPPGIKASISLEWKLPHRPAEVIPSRNLTPNRFPNTFVVESAFPPDDRSVGYERGSSISKAWEESTTGAAIEVATYVSANLQELSGVREDTPDREAKLRDFCVRFAQAAFRRPLDDEQKERYVGHQFAKTRDLDTAVRRVILLVLKSPRFLYREVEGRGDAYDVASRISFGLWDSIPDKTLLEAAAKGELATREQVAKQAERMVSDLRTRTKVRDFFLQWLRVEQVPDLAKDPKQFPEFSTALTSDLRTSLDLFLEDVLWSEGSDFRQLLLADFLYLNGRLAKFYGVDLPADAPFQKVTVDPKERAGVLTHPYLLANFAYTGTSSPIHRGVFITRSVLGRALRPPPEAVAPLAPDLHADLTTRERVTLQTSPAACVTCHGTINPLGFGLENYDAVGRFRREEKGKPIAASGTYETKAGESLPFSGARELATLLAQGEETQAAFVNQLFHHMIKQPIGAFGPSTAPSLRRSFVESDDNIRKLLVDMIVVAAAPAANATGPQADAARPRWDRILAAARTLSQWTRSGRFKRRSPMP